MLTDFVYFDLPDAATVWRWLAWGFLVGLVVTIAYLAVTA